jgi:hypothetical protein
MSGNSRAIFAALALLALAGCDGLSSDGRNRTGALNDSVGTAGLDNAVDAIANNAAAASLPPAAWTYRPGVAPVALYGSAGAEAELAMRCDRRAGQVRFSLPAPAEGATQMAFVIDGRQLAFPATAIDNGLSRVEAIVPLDNPILDRLAGAGARFAIGVGAEPPVDIPGGPAIRRLIEACRAPAVAPVATGTFTGTIPCADCPGIDVTLALSDGRYRMTYAYRERGTFTWQGVVEPATGPDGARILKLTPDDGGEIIWLEQPTDDSILYRTPDNRPNDYLRRYPLVLSEE